MQTASPPQEIAATDPDLLAAPISGRPGVAGAVAVGLLIFLLAFLPRNVGLQTFVTTDEIFWVGRTGSFERGLARGRLDLTFQTGHPGVTTMWAGLLGIGPERAQRLGADNRDVSRGQVSRNPEFLSALADGRRAVALITAIATAAIGLLTWRLLGLGPALVGGTLLALDPFFLAHSQLLHIDALQASFMAIALLAGLVRWQAAGGRGYLVLAALATGLACLSKSPALFLLGFLAPLALFAAWRRGDLRTRRPYLDLLSWLALSAAVYVLLWPALWTAPLETLRGIFGFIGDNANPRHAALAEGGAGSGPLFYPTTFLLRTTPLVLIGLTLLAIELIAARRTVAVVPWSTVRRPSSIVHRPSSVVPALAAYALIFAAAMTAAAKSFDRYLLPAFPALDLLAGLGLTLAARRLRPFGGAGRLLAVAFLLPLLVYPLATSLPYALTWYNPLAGGGSAAQRALTVGWGEGLDVVARYLNARPNAERLKVAMPGEIYTTVLDSQFAGQVMPAEGGDPAANGADYFVTYIRAPQDADPVYDPRFQTWQAEAVARLGGIEYARVYRATLGIPLGATFGDPASPLATLEGYGLDLTSTRTGRPVTARLFWRLLADPPPDSRVLLSLHDPTDREVARTENPLGPFERDRPRPRQYQLQVPTGLPPGEYQLWVALTAAQDQPVPLTAPPTALAPGAPQHPSRAILRTIRVR